MFVLVVDDHPLVTKALVHLLETEEIEAASLSSVKEAIDYIRTVRAPDLVILDAHMPGIGGLAGLSLIQSEFPGLPIALWSGDERQDMIQKAVEGGAIGFLSKAMSIRAIIPAIHLMLAGESYLPAHLMIAKNTAPDDLDRQSNRNLPSSLTPREHAVLEELSRGLSNKEIARNLGIEEITVKLHLRSIYKKINVKTRTQAVALYCNQPPSAMQENSF